MLMLNNLSDSLTHFHPDSRVWVYESSQVIPAAHIAEINVLVQNFTTQWTAHNAALKASGQILADQFIIFVVDETQAGVSGCSIDKSVHFIQEIESKYSLNFMDRMKWKYLDSEQNIVTLTKDEFVKAYADNNITDDTIVFDPLVRHKNELVERWMKPLKESWHHRFVS